MLYNVQELESNLQLLLAEFQELVGQIERATSINETNKKTIITRIPKMLLLHDVMVFLTDKEIVVFSSVCKMLRRLVYSPIGWKVLSYSRLPVRVKYLKERVEEEPQQELDFDEKSLVMNVGQINVLKQKKIVLGESLRREYEHFCSSKQKYQGILDKVRVEKKLQQKYRDKGKILEEQINILDQRNSEYRQNLKQLNDEFESKLKRTNEEENKLVAERQKLQNQKEALVGKIRQYQTQIERIKKEGVKSKEILKRVNNFLLYKEL